MSDFGAWACDFHSDFASDFRTEGNDYAGDFRDFPGDFGGEPRTAKQPPETPETAPPEQAAPRQGNRATRAAHDGGKLAAQAESHGAGYNATPQGHKQRPQGKQGGGGIVIAPNIKTPYRDVKMANRAYSRKAAGIHQQQRKTPHSVSHAGRCQYAMHLKPVIAISTGSRR